jgi:hypothetical protein
MAVLTDAVTAYRAALEEYTRARVPLDWAATQNNLGNALHDLGTRTTRTRFAKRWATTSVLASLLRPCLQTYSADLNQMGVPN